MRHAQSRIVSLSLFLSRSLCLCLSLYLFVWTQTRQFLLTGPGWLSVRVEHGDSCWDHLQLYPHSLLLHHVDDDDVPVVALRHVQDTLETGERSVCVCSGVWGVCNEVQVPEKRETYIKRVIECELLKFIKQIVKLSLSLFLSLSHSSLFLSLSLSFSLSSLFLAVSMFPIACVWGCFRFTLSVPPSTFLSAALVREFQCFSFETQQPYLLRALLCGLSVRKRFAKNRVDSLLTQSVQGRVRVHKWR